jgi:hypothetical protein
MLTDLPFCVDNGIIELGQSTPRLPWFTRKPEPDDRAGR